ncbi:hypothetical protein FIM38_07410 [Helicobacter pylori]|nr:hypothetical protein FIM38_07410 [Helicobacter pylori]
MVSLLALYYGVVFENGDRLALNGYLWGMRVCFWWHLDFSKPNRFEISTYFVKNFYSLSKP